MRWSDDPEKVEGTWEMVYGEQGGEPLPGELVRRARLVLAAGRYAVRIGRDAFKGTHRLDPSRQPKWIDVTASEGRLRGRTLLGIYEFDGSRLRVCFASPGQARPKTFAYGAVLYVWEAPTEMVRYRGGPP